ncbi:hypothetical protein Poli38472_012536 [Pythium oligandrum]|uniref:Uncharacterized protein n=1 Tax=Pythium oligandrum TaxID=41045 RepID=A0A8K1CDU2_PYTOL|nr:hypothetical protein Poli38472_012536 [Pythium oligandrum]|eukprot:TMW61345.1 hypothetical protein Poli38472_012536 [Pythium oligandrum]
MTKLRHRLVVLTSCSSGLAYALATQLAQSGADLVLWDEDLRAAEHLSQELQRLYGVITYAYQVNVRQRDQIQAIATRMKHEVSQIAVIIHAPDVFHRLAGQAFSDIPPPAVEELVELHTMSCFWILESFLALSVENPATCQGHFVWVSTSTHMTGTTRGLVDYCASKTAVLGLHRALEHELSRMNSIGNDSRVERFRSTVVLAPLDRSKLQDRNQSSATPPRGWFSAEEIARETVKAIKRNKREVALPKGISQLYTWLGALLPPSWYEQLLSWLKYPRATDALRS